jgi:hypothetical protein
MLTTQECIMGIITFPVENVLLTDPLLQEEFSIVLSELNNSLDNFKGGECTSKDVTLINKALGKEYLKMGISSIPGLY